jgi:parallel beta-helix repeat protein
VRKEMKRLLAIGVILLFFGMSVSSTGYNIERHSTLSTLDGNTLYVGGSGPNNYTRIQDAIDNASDGDIVYVYAENSPYKENIKIKKSINLIGEDKNTTIIQGNSLYHVIEITARNVKIMGFTIESDGDYPDYGVRITSRGNTVSNNIIRKNDIGISLHESDDNVISNNNFSNNRDRGIFIAFSKNNNIDNNYFCNNGGDAIYCGEPNNVIKNNHLFNDYIEIKGSLGHIIINNTVNGKDRVYLESSSDINLDKGDIGQIILNNCENITIENQDARFDIIRSNNCYISNNVISNSNYGMVLTSSNNNTIKNNDIFDCKWDGLYVVNSEYNEIIKNNISSQFRFHESKHNRVELNIISYIRFYYNSDYNTVNNNTVNNFEIEYSVSNTIMRNTIQNKFNLNQAKLNEIEYNNFEKCVFRSDFSDSNIITKNNFINSRVVFFRYYTDFMKKNNWNRNYWNKPRYLPKPIFGAIFLQPPPMFQLLPWIRFDWNPASEPYDIGV